MNRGILYAFTAYFLWGIFPIYWKQIHFIPAIEIIAHRIVWAFVFVLFLVWMKKDWRKFFTAINDRKVLLTFLLTAILLFVNWLVYIRRIVLMRLNEIPQKAIRRLDFRGDQGLERVILVQDSFGIKTKYFFDIRFVQLFFFTSFFEG